MIRFDFLNWDDNIQITENNYIKSLTLYNIKHNLFHERFTFIPLFCYSLIYKYFGLNPAPYHALNLTAHLLNIILVFVFCRIFFRNNITVLFITFLFAVHPCKVESVAWISELKDMLFTFFSLSAFIIYIRYIRSGLKLQFLIFASLLAFFAAFSKVQGIIVPFAFILLDIYFSRKITYNMFLEKIFLFLLVLFFLKFVYWYLPVILALIIIFYRLSLKYINRFLSERKNILRITVISSLIIIVSVIVYMPPLWSDSSAGTSAFSLADRFFLASYSLWFYLSTFIFPFWLNAVHPYPVRLISGFLPADYYFSSIIMLLAVLLSVYLIIKRKSVSRQVLFGWFFFLLNISIVLHIIPIEGRLITADRYSYLANLGLIFIIGAASEYVLKLNIRKYLIYSLQIIIVAILVVAANNRTYTWQSTKSLFTGVLANNPSIPFALTNLGKEYLNEKKTDSALIFLNKALTFDTLDPGIYFNKALALYMAGKPDSALNCFMKVVKLSRSTTDKALAYSNIGLVYQHAGNDSVANVYFSESVKTDSTVASAYNNRGMYYLKKNKIENAYSDFMKAVSLNNDFAEALNNLGWVLISTGKYEESLKYLDKSLNINPTYDMALVNRGYAKLKLNSLNEAINDLDKALNINPGMIEGYINRGRAYSLSGNFRSAVNDYSFVIGHDSLNVKAITNRAFAYYYLNDFNNSLCDFNMAVNLYPRNAICYLNRGWLKMQIKDYEGALTDFKVSAKIDSTLTSPLINLGWIYLEKKDYLSAKEYFLNVIEKDSLNNEALHWLGMVYIKSGKNGEACDCFRKSSFYGNKLSEKALNEFCR